VTEYEVGTLNALEINGMGYNVVAASNGGEVFDLSLKRKVRV
jgi:hypothetical protein